MSANDPKRTSLLLKNRRSVVCHFSLAAWSQSARLSFAQGVFQGGECSGASSSAQFLNACGHMPKNILIFSDGTGQAGGVTFDENRTNIYKLFRASRCGPNSPIDPAEQVTFYDPHLGRRETIVLHSAG